MARLRVCREGMRVCGEVGRAKGVGVRRCASTHALMSSTWQAGTGRYAAVAAGLIAATAGALGASQATAACSSEGGSGSDAGGSEQGGDVPVTGMRRAMTSLTSLMRGGPPPEAMKGEVVLGEDGKPIVPWTYFASWVRAWLVLACASTCWCTVACAVLLPVAPVALLTVRVYCLNSWCLGLFLAQFLGSVCCG